MQSLLARLRRPFLLAPALAGALLSVSGAQSTLPGDVPEGLAPEDWSSIRQALVASRHAVQPDGEGFQARNPGQRWRTRFDGRGFTTEPDGGGWAWGLELVRYGFAGHERAVTDPLRASADGGRMTYAWDELLEEWYVNDERGLEHGYTVQRRPAGREGIQAPLTFVLSVRGDLEPEVRGAGRDVAFLHADGGVALTYSGLTVFDADGDTLPARFERVTQGLLLTIDERGARYPLTIDPTAQQAYLKASNTEAEDLFGSAIAISADTVVVGAPGEDSSATGVNGDQADNGAPGSGAVYVFVRNGTSWSQQAYLKASNAEAGDRFGVSVGIGGDTIVVGASWEASSATGVNGDQTDNWSPAAGAAYVFTRSATTWTQEAYLKASNTDPDDQFGAPVAISGDTLVVSARTEDSDSRAVGGAQNNNGRPDSGAAYVFVRTGSTWSQQAYLKAFNADEEDVFGVALAITGDTVVVGAPGEDSRRTGVNSGGLNNDLPFSGAAYAFVRTGTAWSQEAYFKASNTDAIDQFGFSVAISGDTLVVGARGEASNATGVNGDQGDNSLQGSGAAYVFVRDMGSWSQQAYLKASNTGPFDQFGFSMAISGDTLVVGALTESSEAKGVDGDQGNDDAPSSGAAYAFARSGGSWSQRHYLKAANTDAGDVFGGVAAISGETLAVGAWRESSNATGVDGDEIDNSAPNAGAAYVFRLEAPECFLVLGTNPLPGTFTDIGHTWETSVSGITSSYAVLLDDIPSFPLPIAGSKKTRHTQRPPTAVGEVYAQVLMWNPLEFPNNPEQWSEGLRATLWSDGTVTAVPYDTQNGITIRMETWHEEGERYVRFPFSIDGF